MLAKLTDEQTSAAQTALHDLTLPLSADEMEQALLGALGELDQNSARTALRTLLSLYSIRAFLEATTEDFAGAVIDGMIDGNISPDLSDANRASFQQKLEALLSCPDTLGLVSKGRVLQSEHANLLCSSRILTDVRAVFSDDAPPRPLASVIFHVLRIQYHQGTELREIYFALDGADLKKLGRDIDRALAKSTALAESLAETPLKPLEAYDNGV